MDINERLAQCEVDIRKLQEEKMRLEKERELRFGDTIFSTVDGGCYRIILYNKKGELEAFSMSGVTGIELKSLPFYGYDRKGKNIFEFLRSKINELQ